MTGQLRVSVDRDLCVNHGQCVLAAPAAFAFDDDEWLVYDTDPGPAQFTAVEAAAGACPVRAITLTDARTP
jgi:ferredoxin